MSPQGDVKKGSGYNWRVLLCAAVAGVAWIIWNYPRTNWSLDVDVSRKLTAEEANSLQDIAKNIEHVVLISIDTCRADHLGCYGYSRDTSPNIDSIAADGVLFNHTVSPTPITLPAHSTMLTGTIPPYHKVRDNNGYILGESNVTLAEILKDNGFVTGAVIGAVVLNSEYGLDQGFDVYDDDIESSTDVSAKYSHRTADKVTARANSWLESNKDNKSFLFIHYFDPHAPYKVYEDHRFRSLSVFSLAADSYDSEIAYTDVHIGKVIAKLKSLGIYESTLLIITADHGEGLEEHNEKTHAFFIYHSTVHVPLIIRLPGGPKGKIKEEVAGLVDITPTVCARLGIAVPDHIEGIDLFGKLSFSKERAIYSESLYPTKFELGPLMGLTGSRWKYIHSSRPELFDLAVDASEKKNKFAAADDKSVSMQSDLKKLINSMSEAGGEAVRFVPDAEAVKRLESLGYVSGAVDDNITFEQDRPNPRDNADLFRLHSLCMSLCFQGKYEKAKKVCNKMLKRFPELPEAYFLRGIVAGYQQDMDILVEYNLKYIELVESQYTGKDAFGLGTQLSTAHSNVGVALAQKEDFVNAEMYFEKAVYYKPKSKENLMNLVKCRLKLKDNEGVAKSYIRLFDLKPVSLETVYYLRQIGSILLSEGKYQAAIACWEKFIDDSESDHNAMYNMSLGWLGLGKLEKAQEYLEMALELEPENNLYNDKMAEILVRQGKNSQAVETRGKGL